AVGVRRIVQAQQNEMSLEARYTANGQHQNQNYVKEFLTTTGGTTNSPDEIGLTDSETDVGELSLKYDLTKPLSKKVKLDAGFKGAVKSTDYDNLLTRRLENASSPFNTQAS